MYLLVNALPVSPLRAGDIDHAISRQPEPETSRIASSHDTWVQIPHGIWYPI